ncbi:hypothetical protein, partial [Chromobacterium amazonense]|uniref:hypothetical protein n=1 Tax=Chromobacterium amazonense TaxID=1382803 RepID=UPI0031F71963
MERILAGFRELKDIVSFFQATITERIYGIDLWVSAIEEVIAGQRGLTIPIVGVAPVDVTIRETPGELFTRAAPTEATRGSSPVEASTGE